MKTRMLLGTALAVLLAGAATAAPKSAADRSPMTPDKPTAAMKVDGKAEIGDFGFDMAGMDKSVAPGNDFYLYANGNWNKTTEIPADRASWGAFTVLDDLSRERTRSIIETASKGSPAAGSVGQQVGDYYASFMDEAAIENAGAKPLQADLAKVAAIRTKADLARAFGAEVRSEGPTPFPGYINQDAKAPDHYIVYLFQGGLGLPDRDYYLKDDAKFADVRAKYLTHVARMLELAGTPAAEAKTKAQAIFDLEKKVATVHWTRVESRDDDKTYNKWSKADFAAKAPGFDWAAYLDASGVGGQDAFIVGQPSAVTGMAKIIADTPLETWKDWLAYQVIADRAPVLPKAFVDENFAFTGTVLSGQPQIQPRWKRGVSQVNNAMGEAVGQLYVAKYFPPASKAAADQLVKNLIAAMDKRLANLTWMAPETKVKAREKLAAFTPKIGYPDKWRDYSGLKVVRGDAYGNAVRAATFDYDYNLAKLGKPIDRGEWFMTPMEINAYANPVMNEVVFPAAILQPPFFDPNADPAVNYGAIGAVIGHEISHHFDDQGRKYDKTGALTDWWTPEDVKRFKEYTDRVVAQYSAYEPLAGMHVNGELTLGENMADLAGLFVAHDAWLISLGGKPAPVIDGLTGEQRFFLGYAQVWRRKMRDAALQQAITTDPHTPGMFRPYVVRNMDAWYDAFAVKPGTKYYLAPDQRIHVW